ncbi:ATP-binding protein [Kutzneria kofuensis]|uniref:Helicase HerA central domain-containing protein n=1 Tax=Kutzneria kofuensis TaxID=103725 RepID=A0A7W9NMW4_9PSEU|nr:ATP-binding protein [Kutzneria kofuensis]MBB5897966.1 hypothetical protein [Kutzneria kofuensis]
MATAVRWSEFDLHELTEVPAPAEHRRGEDGERGDRDGYADDPLAALAVALAGAHAGLTATGHHAPVVVSAWVRPPNARRMHFLVGGNPDFTPAMGTGPGEVLFPPGALATPLGRGQTTLLDLFDCWVPCTGHPDALWAPTDPKHAKPQARRGSFEQYVAHLRQPFAWVVLAEPARAQEVQPELDRLVREILPLSRTEVGEANRISLERKQSRHRELSRALLGNAWRIRVLVGGCDGAVTENVAALLCAAADLDNQPYVLTPSGRATGLAGAAQHEGVLAGTDLLVRLTRPPRRELPGIRVVEPRRFDVTPDAPADEGLLLGGVLDAARSEVGALTASRDSLNRHTFVCGATGSGKSFTVRHLLAEATRAGLPWLVVEPAKAEYGRMANRLARLGGDVVVLQPGRADDPPVGFNPLAPARVTDADGTERVFPLQTHLDLVRALFLATFDPQEPFPQILTTSLTRSYEELGWDVTLGEAAHDGAEPRYPTLTDLQRVAAIVVDEIGYGAEIAANMQGFVKVRMRSLGQGVIGRFLNDAHPLDFGRLMRRNVVLEIEDVGDDTDKAFLMGAVLLQLTEHLKLLHGNRSQVPLHHLTVIEEAHRLLRNPGEDADSAAGRAVETFASLLAEVRAYGEGLVVVEQIPSKLIPDVIKNTAVKVVHRLPAEDDRKSVGATMNLDDGQSRNVVSLQPREAAVFTDGMDRPLLVRVPDGRKAEEGAARPAPVADLIRTVRSSTCGSECQAAACSLADIARGNQLLARYPVLTVWTELTVLAHLANAPNPALQPRYRDILLDAASVRTLECALSQAVERAVRTRSAQLQPTMRPWLFAAHCNAVQVNALWHGADHRCEDDDPLFLAESYKWARVLQWLEGDDDAPRHQDSEAWERFYRQPIPGATRADQRAVVEGWQDELYRDEAGRNAVTYGTSRPSALESALGAQADGGDAWRRAVARAVDWFTGDTRWIWSHVLPIGSET